MSSSRRNLESLTVAALVIVASLVTGCSAARKELAAPTLRAPVAQAPAPPRLERNHFGRDGSGSISEEHLRAVLDAPVFLEERARLGVVQVTDGYGSDREVPLTDTPEVLTRLLGDSGLFEVTSEVSTDWPADRGISGLRELAARYRSEYLLLYRHRFVDRSYTNAWGWLYVTLVGALAVPARTLEAAGVMEATLFDVKTGTILFTVFERVHGKRDSTVWHTERKRNDLQRRLLADAAEGLAEKVVSKARVLAAARPEPTRPTEQLSVASPPALPPADASPSPR